MRRMQLNLYRDEIDLKHCQGKRIPVQHIDHPVDPSLPWWKVLDIPKKDVCKLPNKQACVFCLSTEDCVDKLGQFLHHSFSGKLIMQYHCDVLKYCAKKGYYCSWL